MNPDYDMQDAEELEAIINSSCTCKYTEAIAEIKNYMYFPDKIKKDAIKDCLQRIKSRDKKWALLNCQNKSLIVRTVARIILKGC